MSVIVTGVRVTPGPLNLALQEEESRRQKKRILNQLSIYLLKLETEGKVLTPLNLSQMGKISFSANREDGHSRGEKSSVIDK